MGHDNLILSQGQPDPAWDTLRIRIARRNQDSYDALERLIVTFSRRVVGYIGKQLRKEYSLQDESLDVIQAESTSLANVVFYRAWNEINEFDPERGTLEQWLINLSWQTVRGFIRQHRKRRIAETLFAEEVSLLHKALVADNLLKEAILQEVANLSVDKQEIFYLHYIEQWQIKEIAQHKGLPEGSVKRVLHEIRKAIKAKLR